MSTGFYDMGQFSVISGSIIMVNGLMENEITESYIAEKSLKYVTIVGCFKKSDQIRLTKHFIFKTQRLSILNQPNLLNIEESLKTDHKQIGVIVDGDCKNITSFLRQSGTLNFFDVKHHWLIFSSSSNLSELFENTKLNINADVQVVVPQKTKWLVNDVYNPASEHGGTFQSVILGYYDKTDGYQARETQSKYWVRRNMTGVTFKTIVVLPVPFKGSLSDYLASDSQREINTFNRFHHRLVQFCSDYYNFSMNIKVDKSWGYKISEKSFDGLVGAMERHQVDFGSSPLFVREDRATVMEYGRRTWILRAAFIFRNPKAKTSLEIFLKPLSWSIWLSTIFSGTVVVFALKLSLTYEKINLRSQVDTSWSYLIISTVGAFCQQGSTRTPTLICGRITTIFLFLLSVIIYQFYSASIVSNLLQKPATVVRSVKEILQSTMKAGCEDILYNRDYFKYTIDKPSKDLYYKKILGPRNTSNFFPPEYGVGLVRKGGYAFHVELATAYPIIKDSFGDKAICELREVQMYRTQPMHANYQKYSPFRDMLDTCLQRLGENGILFREIRHWHPSKPACIQSSKSMVFGVGLDDFYPALISLAVGYFCSLVILAIERFVYKKSQADVGYALFPFTP